MKRLRRKDKIEVAQRICELFETGKYTFESCCLANSIKPATFRCWAAPSVDNIESIGADKYKKVLERGYIQEIARMYKDAKQLSSTNYKMLVINKARESLLKSITGFYCEETVTETKRLSTQNVDLLYIRKFQKYVPPNVTAIIFALKNLDREVFDTMKNGSEKPELDILANLSLKELANIVYRE